MGIIFFLMKEKKIHAVWEKAIDLKAVLIA